MSWQVYKREELQVIADLCIKHNVLCISDEVYEWLTYDAARHVKIGETQTARLQCKAAMMGPTLFVSEW